MATAEWQSQQSPASQYKVVDTNVFKAKAPVFSQSSKTVRIKPLVKNDAPSPVTYTASFNTVSNRSRSPQAGFASKGRNYIEQAIRSKQNIPSPANYDVDRARRFVTIGARSSYR